MVGQETYRKTIRDAYPNLEIVSTEFKDHGQNSDVVVVNNEIVFRFPRYPHLLEKLAIEAAILNHVHRVVELAVPVPTFISLEKEVGEAFVGYRLIPGDPLWRPTFHAIESTEIVGRLAHQLATFLRSLHGVDVSLLGLDLPVSDTYKECADIYSRIKKKLFVHMRPDARVWATDHFESFLQEGKNFAYRRVLKHGDFGPSNILFDRKKGVITGVIDFGSASLGDPAYDFAGLLSGYGEGFVESCSTWYPEVADFDDRIRFYRGIFALLEALFGIENGDERAFKAGIDPYL